MAESEKSQPQLPEPLFPAEFGSPAAFLAAISASSSAFMAYIDRKGIFQYVNDNYAAWFGKRPADLVGMNLRELYGKEALDQFAPFIRRAFDGQFVHYERQAFRPDGTSYWLSVALSPHHAADGHISGLFSCALEVDELKRKSEELDQTVRELDFHMENSPLGMIEWSGELTVKRWSPQVERLFGWKEEEALGKRPSELGLVHPDSLAQVRELTQELTSGAVKRNRMLAKNVARDGRTLFCEWYNSAFAGPDGKTTSIMSLVQDVTLRIEAEEQLKRLAVLDSLTGLANRQSLISRLEHAISRAERTEEKLALLFVDLNKFKPVNDTFGHAVGDGLLVEIASRLRECVRASDTVARLGGDEFVVLLETQVNAQTPGVIADRIRAALGMGFRIRDHDLQIGASIGTATYPEDGRTAVALIHCADEHMYAVKRQ